MRLLELFSGTHSVGKVFEKLGYEVISLDLHKATINTNILEWNYKEAFDKKYFDVIWASPPCVSFSNLRNCNIGRRIKSLNGQIATKELLHKDMMENGLPILRKTQEIIKYFEPEFWFIENPQTGKMKNFMKDVKHYDVDYCKYGFDYKKPTRIWTNLEGFKPKRCKKDCNSIIKYEGKTFHKNNLGSKTYSKLARKYNKSFGKGTTRNQRYRIPEKLTKDLLDIIITTKIKNGNINYLLPLIKLIM